MAEVDLLEVRNLRKTYRGAKRPAVDVAQFVLQAGVTALLTGPNGSGKSTFLHLLAGLLRAERGAEFSWQGQAGRHPRLGSEISLMHQNPVMFSGSVRANVKYAASRAQEPHISVDQELGWAGMEHLSDSPAASLSIGHQRLVALMRVTALRPRALLLDEPSSHIANGHLHVFAQLAQQARERGQAVLIATHDARLVELLGGSRCLKMASGSIADGV